ncbi:MAG: cellulase family glycosylhydrolase [Bacteroidetes bacterium]|nr:cellulase family glycosylhydrolase [Bacteroidota bacterium]
MRRNTYYLHLRRMKTGGGKFLSALFFCLIAICFLQGQSTFYVSGKYLLDPCGDTVLLRGINYAPYNWGYDQSSEETVEIEKTGANCVRLVWYADGSAPYYTNENLDSVLARCAERRMIPVLELHDQTCQNDSAQLVSLADWYTGPDVAAILQKHQAYLIVNIANEVLYHRWAAVPSAAVNSYINTYSTIVNRLRNGGLNFPLMIDAPDCGTDISLIGSVAAALQNADPKHNLMFSAHAYWYSYAQNDSLQMAALLSAASALNFPVILGEVANYQDDANPCQYGLNYRALFHLCETFQMPWICWGWSHDNCTARQLSTNGQFGSLSAYGNEVVNHPDYGLKNKAVRSYYMLYNQQCLSTGVLDYRQEEGFVVSPVASGSLTIQSTMADVQRITITDMAGRVVRSCVLPPDETTIVALPSGIYLIASENKKVIRKVVY